MYKICCRFSGSRLDLSNKRSSLSFHYIFFEQKGHSRADELLAVGAKDFTGIGLTEMTVLECVDIPVEYLGHTVPLDLAADGDFDDIVLHIDTGADEMFCGQDREQSAST